ncbi:ABC transporter ATP-binding protein [Citricoccus zhacaiensis]|uniref:ABC transporter ATP-binding protein n=1 Tax=Citricoccus zhacaiensis TaxID=489142 RepID=A0ABQ2LSC3_9MICC|nr:ABC transporter permease [Citricoccus zhacaiensis]GGO42586.1 ABC transporter ATP-binding protein [Citricoccus zhacaiensis]
MLKLALSQLRDQPRRYISVLLAITIGVTFLASALLVGSSSTASLRNSIGATYSKADLVVGPSSGSGDTFDAMTSMAEVAGTSSEPGPLQDVEGVKDAYAHVVSSVGVQRPSDAEGEGTWSPDSDFAMASTVPEDTSLVAERLTAGEYPAAGSTTEITLDERTAENFGLDVGSSTFLMSGMSSDAAGRKVTVSGLTEVSQNPSAIGAIQLKVDDALAEALKLDAVQAMAPEAGAAGEEAVDPEEILGQDYAEYVLISLEDGADQAAVQAALQEFAKSEGMAVTVATPDVQAQEQVAQMAGSNVFVWVLGAFAVIALLVTALVISNTFSVLVAQRSRDLALQRALGASRRQVRGSVLVEAGVIGIIGAIIGSALASGIVAALVLWGSTNEGFGFLTFEANPRDLLACVAVGMVMTIIASMSAALAATRVSPLEAMRPREDAAVGNRAGALRLVFGTLFLAVGAAGLVWGAAEANLVTAVAGGALSFVGVLMLAVLFVPAVVSVAGLAARPAGVPGRMARLNATRNPGRTASTAAALLIGTTLVAMMLTGGRTAQQQMDTIFATEFPVDLQVELVSGSGNESAVGAAPPAGDGSGAAGGMGLDSSEAQTARDNVAQVEGIDAAALLLPAGVTEPAAGDGSASGEGSDAGAPVYAADPADLRSVVSGMPEGVGADRLGEPGTILMPNTVETDTVTVTGASGSLELEVIQSASSTVRPVITLEDAQSIGLAENAGAAPQLWLNASDTVTMDGLQELNTGIAQAAGVSQDKISGDLSMRLMFSVVIDGMLMVVTALLAVSVLIALIGVANTLSLSAIERSRENSLMRALGLTRRGLRGMLALEAVLISGVAALIGSALGTVYGGLGAHTVFAPMAAGIGQSIVWPVVPWWELAVIVGVSVLAGLLASVAPSQRAAKLAPVQGLALA